MERKHVYEIDFLRTFIMLGVIAVHTMTIYNNQLVKDSRSFLMMSSVHSSMHVMRMVFMFITGFVLVLTNRSREFHTLRFWGKRLPYIIIPYVFWNIVYILFKSSYSINLQGSLFLKKLAVSLLHGDQFYIYYVLVTLQFYMVFPFLFWFLKKFARYHGQIFIYSVAFQIIMMTFYKFAIPQLNTSNWPYLLSHYGIFLLTYQCYYITGSIFAFHFKEILGFLENHRRFLFTSMGIYIVLMWLHYYFDRLILKESDNKAQSVHQPVYLPYALLMIAVILLLGSMWNRQRLKNHWKPFSKLVDVASKTSFGIYLIQPFPLYIMKKYIIPLLPQNKWLLFTTLPTAILLVYFSSMLIAYLFNNLPVLSYCVGKKTKWPGYRKIQSEVEKKI